MARGAAWGWFAAGAGAGAALALVLARQMLMRHGRSARRVGGVCRLREGMFEQYTQLHDHTWDEVMRRMYVCGIRNFVVYLHEETRVMFSHFEYVGNDFERDMKAIGEDPVVNRWWSFCEPCQEPYHWDGPTPSQGGDGGPGGAWWDPLVCLNHCGGWPVLYSNRWPDPDFVPNNPKGMTSSSSQVDGLKSI
mmetsp:Transcript_5801/g.10872  ORF Transcript_5801/g.10872 Transcript_5801/m.10872 type:complete len:192 (+) Transcript_5801:66-641(+)